MEVELGLEGKHIPAPKNYKAISKVENKQVIQIKRKCFSKDKDPEQLIQYIS